MRRTLENQESNSVAGVEKIQHRVRANSILSLLYQAQTGSNPVRMPGNTASPLAPQGFAALKVQRESI